MKRATAIILSAGFATMLSWPASAQTLYLDCSRAANPSLCRENQEQQRREENGFRARDYQAMRNRAYCLWSGCDGAVKIDRKSACVVRRYIMRHPKADAGDEANLVPCIRGGY